MKVKELIDALSRLDGEQEVFVSQGTGDYWGSVIATTIEDVSILRTKWSDYHRAKKIVEWDSEEGDEGVEEVIVIG